MPSRSARSIKLDNEYKVSSTVPGWGGNQESELAIIVTITPIIYNFANPTELCWI